MPKKTLRAARALKNIEYENPIPKLLTIRSNWSKIREKLR